MSDIIKILPDVIANQIAAGEVVQRPASVVKELLENSVDAGATHLQLVIKDAGRTLIQVIDNGKGMSETDARLCFERHATSKLSSSDDLFNLKTKGFRGEALASIASVAQVELKTRLHSEELGTLIENEGCKVLNQEPEACPPGTSIAVKNLFFNIPARRNFLKSNTAELGHITDEFTRVALAHPDVAFTFSHNNNTLYNLPRTTLRQRIINLFGNPYNERIVPLSSDTTVVSVSGYVGKPQFAKKSRGEQFFFVNNRFIKNSYLNHAVMSAYDGLLPYESHPSYFIFLEVDPKTIDVNIHPTKTEIKFEDDKTIYNILKSTVKMSLGQYNLAPSLDFETETAIELPLPNAYYPVKPPTISVNPNYNPFEVEQKNTRENTTKPSTPYNNGSLNKQVVPGNWEDLYAIASTENHGVTPPATIGVQETLLLEAQTENKTQNCFQYQYKYIVTNVKSGVIIIDQHLAHERILFEQYLLAMQKHDIAAQQLLFPITLELTLQEFALMGEVEDVLNQMGFNLSPFGTSTYVVNGIPPYIQENEVSSFIERIMRDIKDNYGEIKNNKLEVIAKWMAKHSAVKYGKSLSNEEMQDLIGRLFACSAPYASAFGRPTMLTITQDELLRRFA